MVKKKKTIKTKELNASPLISCLFKDNLPEDYLKKNNFLIIYDKNKKISSYIIDKNKKIQSIKVGENRIGVPLYEIDSIAECEEGIVDLFEAASECNKAVIRRKISKHSIIELITYIGKHDLFPHNLLINNKKVLKNIHVKSKLVSYFSSILHIVESKKVPKDRMFIMAKPEFLGVCPYIKKKNTVKKIGFGVINPKGIACMKIIQEKQPSSNTC